MMSQAYMLVYVRKSEIANTLQPIDLTTVDRAIVQKVRSENEELKKFEFWNRNRLFYLVLPEMLREASFYENILGFESHFEDSDRVSRLLRDIQRRYCLVVPKDDTLNELFKQIQALLDLDWSYFLLYKYDNFHRRLVKVVNSDHINKNGGLDFKNASKRLKKYFKNDSEEHYTVLYLDFVDPALRKKTFCESRLPCTALAEEYAEAFGNDESFLNCYSIKPVEVVKQTEVDKANFMRFACSDDILHLVKQFTATGPKFFGTFTGRQTVSEAHIRQWLGAEFKPDDTVVYVEVYENRQPFIVYSPTKVYPKSHEHERDWEQTSPEDCVLVTFMSKALEREYLHIMKDLLYRNATVFLVSEEREETSAKLDLHMKLPDLFEFISVTRLQGNVSPDQIGVRIQEYNEYDYPVKSVLFNNPQVARLTLEDIIDRTRSEFISYFVSEFSWQTLQSQFNIEFNLFGPDSVRALNSSRLFNRDMRTSELIDHLKDMFETHLKQMNQQLKEARSSTVEIS